MSKNAMLLQAVGASQKLTAQAAGTKNGTMTWISSNPGVATVSADGMVTVSYTHLDVYKRQVVGMRYASASVMQGAAEVIAYGTAVKFV